MEIKLVGEGVSIGVGGEKQESDSWEGTVIGNYC